MDETRNWKVITVNEDEEPILKYDPHRDEIVNILTGEVIQGHWMIIMVDYTCIHEEQIQGQSRKIAELETRADYKDKRIDDLYVKIEKMEDKIDTLNDNVNQLILLSNKGDTDLELRLKAIETELELQKQVATENHNRVSQLLALVGVGLTIITILINVYFKMIWISTL